MEGNARAGRYHARKRISDLATTILCLLVAPVKAALEGLLAVQDELAEELGQAGADRFRGLAAAMLGDMPNRCNRKLDSFACANFWPTACKNRKTVENDE